MTHCTLFYILCRPTVVESGAILIKTHPLIPATRPPRNTSTYLYLTFLFTSQGRGARRPATPNSQNDRPCMSGFSGHGDFKFLRQFQHGCIAYFFSLSLSLSLSLCVCVCVCVCVCAPSCFVCLHVIISFHRSTILLLMCVHFLNLISVFVIYDNEFQQFQIQIGHTV